MFSAAIPTTNRPRNAPPPDTFPPEHRPGEVRRYRDAHGQQANHGDDRDAGGFDAELQQSPPHPTSYGSVGRPTKSELIVHLSRSKLCLWPARVGLSALSRSAAFPQLFTCRRALAKIDDSKKVFPRGGIDLTNGLASGGDAYREGTRGMSVDGFAKFDGSQQLAAWLDRLDAFVTALDAIDADDPYSFCEDAWDIWESAAISNPPAGHRSGNASCAGRN